MASDSLNESHTKVIINIVDVNDLPPVFDQKHYQRCLNEEEPAPYSIMQVNNELLFIVTPITLYSNIDSTLYNMCKR